MNTKYLIIQFVVGSLILAGVIYYFGINNYISILSTVNIWWFLLACIPAFLISFVTAFQVWYICTRSGLKFRFIDSLFISNWGGLIQFFNAGLDLLYTIEATKNYAHTDRTTVLNRLSFMYSIGSIITVIGFSLGIYYIGSGISSGLSVWLSISAYILLILSVLFIVFAIGPIQVRRIKHYLFKRSKLLNKLFGKLMSDELVTFRKQSLILLISGILNWVFKAFEWVFLAYALGFSLPFLFCFLVFFVVDLARQVPFVPTNMGLLDVVTAIGLSTGGMTLAAGLVFAMINRFDNIIANAFVFAFPKYITSVFENLRSKPDIPTIPKDMKINPLPQKDGLRVLNLGCGSQSYGTDRVDVRETSATTKVADLEIPFPFETDTFDIVHSRNLLEHMRNVGLHLSECFRVLKPNGIIDITTDNASCMRYYLLGTHTGRYEKLHPGDHHFSIFTKKHLQNHFEAVGFKVVGIDYVKTDTFGRFIDMVTFGHPRIRVIAVKEDA